MTDATVASPEAATDEPETIETPTTATAPPTPAAPLADPEAIAVPLPASPGPANVSPDNTTLAYLQRDVEGKLRLWLQSIDETDEGAPRALDLPFEPLAELEASGDRVPAGLDDDGPQWSPDGTALALAGILPGGGPADLWWVEVASGEARRLTDHPAADRGPRWSPDGQTIAFTSFRDGRDTVCIVPAEGGPVTQLTDGLQDDRDPAWSRDGTQLAFRRAVVGHPTHHDIWVLTLATGELKQVTNVPGRAAGKAANRRSPSWAPNRSLIAFVTDEKEWDGIAVVNPDNLSGWTLADEPGDKGEVRWSPNGLRILYTRTQGAITHCCAKGTSAAKADVLDTLDGVARSPRWLGDFRVVYLHATPTKPWRFVVQDAKTETERRELAPAAPWAGPREGLVAPESLEVEVGDGATIAGLFYRPPTTEAPAVVALGEGPPVRQAATVDPVRLALAAAGFAVFAPNLRGTPGAGRAFTNQLAELADQELEIADLADIAKALRETEGIAGERIAIVGHGFGGTLALLAAAARPGHYAAVVAVDPIVDWEREIDTADGAWRSWVLETFGLPALPGGRYPLRSPATFAALLEIPVLLVGTPAASAARAAQLDAFAALLDELGIGYERAAVTDPTGEVAGLCVDFLRRRLARSDAVGAPPAAAVDVPAASILEAESPLEAGGAESTELNAQLAERAGDEG